jgi:hypothetical protein
MKLIIDVRNPETAYLRNGECCGSRSDDGGYCCVARSCSATVRASIGKIDCAQSHYEDKQNRNKADDNCEQW